MRNCLKTMTVIGALAFTGATATTALAASVHWKQGSPHFTDNGLTLTQKATLVGLGNGDVVVNMRATGNPKATCTNPGSGVHQPAGHNPAAVALTGTVAIPASAVKNGNASYSVTTNGPLSPVAGAPDCPNSNWIEDITDIAFTSSSVTVSQNGLTVMSGPKGTCAFNPPTSNGAVLGFICG